MIKRKCFHDLKEHLSKKEISLITGPRQSGKTTLMLLLKDYLDRQGQTTLFLSLDFESDKPFFVSQRSLIDKIKLEIGEKRGYVFIDEIQRKENAGLFIKGIYDFNQPYKFIISGSGSMELKEKIHESLAGRKRVFELNTVSFDEFVDFKTDYRYEQRLDEFFDVEKIKTKDFLLEYLNFGGYPALVQETVLKEKIKIIDEIYHSVLEKDLAYLLKIEKLDSFSSLVKMLADQTGKLINYSELSSTLGIAVQTVKNYFWYARKVFVIHKLAPFYKNVRKEITKSPSVYFYDLGLRNYLLGLFGNLNIPSELGFLFQNFVFNILREKLTFTGGELNFWRTKDKAEVDFIISFGRKIIPVEVKFKQLEKPDIGRSMRNFISVYKPQQALIINLAFKHTRIIDGVVIKFMPFYEIRKLKIQPMKKIKLDFHN